MSVFMISCILNVILLGLVVIYRRITREAHKQARNQKIKADSAEALYQNLLAQTIAEKLFKEKEQSKPEFAYQPFTKAELKSLRHYLHPDKNAGKTHDLWVKVNAVYENKV